MKTLVIIIATALISTLASAEQNNYSSNTHYGVSVAQNHTLSGHGSNIAFNTSVRKSNKSLEVGAIISSTENRLSGADLKYKVFICSPNEFVHQNKKVKTYFQYNCMYQKKTVSESLNTISSLKSAETITTTGRTATIEHYAGFGLQVKVMSNVHIDSSIGAGAYLGSVKAEERMDNKNAGLSVSFKIGLGITLN